METTHIEYLLANTADLLVTKGDKLLLDDIKRLLAENPINCIESFAEDIFEYATSDIDEDSFNYDDYIELFANNEELHFKGEIITKELWIKVISLIEERLGKIADVFLLRESDLVADNAPEINISIEWKDYQECTNTYTISLIECGLIIVFDWNDNNTEEQCYFSPKVVREMIDYLKQINYLSLEPIYIDDSKVNYLDTGREFFLNRFRIKVTAGDKFKNVCNYDNCNSALSDFEKYVDELVFKKFRKHTCKPDTCIFCNSVNIVDFNYSKPISEVIVESENSNCREECHCVAKYGPAWVCQDCETIYFRE